jgi:excisionase family DNA binding protein
MELVKRRIGKSSEEVQTMTVGEAADLLHMPQQSVRRLIAEGKIGSIPKPRPGGIVHRLIAEDVTTYHEQIRGRIGRPSRDLDDVPLSAGERNDGKRYKGRCLEVARQQGMTVLDFVTWMGVDWSYAYRVDHLVKDVRNPSPAYRQKAAEVLNTPVEELFIEISD